MVNIINTSDLGLIYIQPISTGEDFDAPSIRVGGPSFESFQELSIERTKFDYDFTLLTGRFLEDE